MYNTTEQFAELNQASVDYALRFSQIALDNTERLFKVQIVRDTPMELPAITAWADARESRGEVAGEPARAAAPAPRAPAAPRSATGEKLGRNDPCYCGSGKKYKKCHYLKG